MQNLLNSKIKTLKLGQQILDQVRQLQTKSERIFYLCYVIKSRDRGVKNTKGHLDEEDQ